MVLKKLSRARRDTVLPVLGESAAVRNANSLDGALKGLANAFNAGRCSCRDNKACFSRSFVKQERVGL